MRIKNGVTADQSSKKQFFLENVNFMFREIRYSSTDAALQKEKIH